MHEKQSLCLLILDAAFEALAELPFDITHLHPPKTASLGGKATG